MWTSYLQIVITFSIIIIIIIIFFNNNNKTLFID